MQSDSHQLPDTLLTALRCPVKKLAGPGKLSILDFSSLWEKNKMLKVECLK